MIFHTNIEKDTLENNNYRKVISTQSNIQLVLMSLKPKEEIGNEIHENKENKENEKIQYIENVLK